MDIFVDVLLKNFKELTWMSISLQLGCPARESKKLLIEIVEAALSSELLREDFSIQCIFNGPSPEDSGVRQLVQTQAVRGDWPPKSYLSSVYGDDAVNGLDVCLQTVWLAKQNLEMDDSLVATDDLFYDLYGKAQKSATQDKLYIAPFSNRLMSKLRTRAKIVGDTAAGGGPSAQASANIIPKQEIKAPPVTPVVKKEQVLKEAAPKEAPNTPAKPAAKRRKNNPRKTQCIAEPTVSPVVALGLTASEPPTIAGPTPKIPDERFVEFPSKTEDRQIDEVQMEDIPMAPEPVTTKQQSLFEADEEIDDGPPQSHVAASAIVRDSSGNSPKTDVSAQIFGQSKKTVIETSSKGGLSFGKQAVPQPSATAPTTTESRKRSGGGTLDAFFRKG